jgi:hypothetical protein
MPQSGRTPLSAELILRLQTTAGNRAVQRLMERRKASEALPEPEPAPVPAPSHRLSWVGGGAIIGALAGGALWMHDPASLLYPIALPLATTGLAWALHAQVQSRR